MKYDLYVCVYTAIHVCMHTQICMHTHMYKCVHCAYTHMYTHVYTHIYTYLYTPAYTIIKKHSPQTDRRATYVWKGDQARSWWKKLHFNFIINVSRRTYPYITWISKTKLKINVDFVDHLKIWASVLFPLLPSGHTRLVSHPIPAPPLLPATCSS